MKQKAFPSPGLMYFWFLNDACEPAHIAAQIAEFRKAGIAGVVLHPRAGLQVPYGGDDWFQFIRETTLACAAAGLKVWLYDEDPYPSGNAGGWIVAEHPECVGRIIERFEAPRDLGAGDLFGFPAGKLLWAGLVPVAGRRTAVELTARVGMLRRKWSVLDPWDSRWFYPATPRYPITIAETTEPEFGIRLPAVPRGMAFAAFVARPAGQQQPWGTVVDTLDPDVTRRYIERTHERYRSAMGDLFGREISAIFTDEAKYPIPRPWTPALFDGFQRSYGYDLRPRLDDLFSGSDHLDAWRTRIHYREWCGRRFEEAWLAPVSAWCRRNGLPLVGHISPEDDPVEQVSCVSNLMPLQKHFALGGLDLIIPAVGDAEHPIINVGITAASSSAQQQGKPGVMSESLAASGQDATAEQARRILSWQTVMGLTTPVIHGIYSSTAGNRLLDAPPDWGPNSPRWDGLREIERDLKPVQEFMIGAAQTAPAAILWPIRSFYTSTASWQHEAGGRRGALVTLLLRCLERQVGVHFLDEEALWGATARGGRLALGRARYSHVLVPPAVVLHARTLAALERFRRSGGWLRLTGEAPAVVQAGRELKACDLSGWPRAAPAEAVAGLPRLIDLAGPGRADVRCSTWTKGRERRTFLINIGRLDRRVRVAGQPVDLKAGRIEVLRHD